MRNFKVIPEADFATTMEREVMPALRAVRRDGTFSGFDGKQLAWHSFTVPKASTAVVILHGYTESGEKYDEMAWYFLSQGYSVYIYDQRGHGKSCRDVPDKTLTHIEHFEDYVLDLEKFLDQVVPQDPTLYLYAHSMGGAIAALFLEKHPDYFVKAVLSSPMVAPVTGKYSAFAGRALCRAYMLMGKSKERIFLSQPYPGEEKFENACSSSEVRFSRYEQFKRTHEDYQNYSPTYRWTYESLKIEKKILEKDMPEKIRAKVLVFSAEDDDVVLIPQQKELAERIPGCKFRTLPNVKHELFMSTDKTMVPYVTELLTFFGKD